MLMVSACTAHNPSLRESDLRADMYFIEEYRIAASFPEIQRALYKHQAACGMAAEFRMDQRQASYGTLRYPLSPDAGWDNAVLLDLTALSSGNTIARAYSYQAAGARVVPAILESIRAPGVCDPATQETLSTKE